MSDWIEQYSAALAQRDIREQAHQPYIDAYTQLADRTAVLETSPPTAAVPTSPQPGTARSSTPISKGKRASTTDPDVSPAEHLSRLRVDLATTQKARASLQTQVDELNTALSVLQTQQKASTAQLARLTRQKVEVERKLRDRDEELRGKDKLVEQAQDEMVALGLQLNMAEARSEKLGRENKELVDRWMKRMGEEADRVNRDSKWE